MGRDSLEKFYRSIRNVADFPTPGILFRDITPLWLDADLFHQAVERMTDPVRDLRVDKILAVESRGFILGAPMAVALGVGLVPARKVGKLPWKRRRIEYALEYGADAIEVHLDAIQEGDRVLVVDDLLATGGTAQAAGQAVTEAEGQLVGFNFLVELEDLGGREKLPAGEVWSLLTYPRAEQ
jgi:adenine phosphoribosyltransferase